MHNEGMEHIASRIAEIARNIQIVGADPVTRHGFTQVPNFILTKKELSVGAKLAYAILLKGGRRVLSRSNEAWRRYGRRGAQRSYLSKGTRSRWPS
jgi:hypothetical protein